MTESNASRADTHKPAPAANASADFTRRMLCGGIAGSVAKTVTNPLERIKMLSQTGEHSANRTSILPIFRNIIKTEGILGLWAGNGVNLIRIFPAKAVTFSSNDLYKAAIRKSSGISSDQPLPTHYSFLAGGMAGASATAVTYPLDFVHGRISGKVAGVGVTNEAVNAMPKKIYKGILHTITVTVKDEGVLALYKGLTATLIGAFIYLGFQFGTVGALERQFPHEGEESTPLRKLMFGAVGGITAGLFTYPNDTVRRMMQLQGSRGTDVVYKGYWDCVVRIYTAHGIARFYRGLTVNLLRMAPNTAVQFGTYELLKQHTAKWHIENDGATRPPGLISLR